MPAFFVNCSIATMRVFLEHIRIGLLIGLRSNALKALLALGAVLLAVSFLSGAFSLRQPLVVTLDVGLSGIRLLTLLLSLFWVQESFVREMERKTVFLVFSFPVSRDNYVLGRLCGILLLLLLSIVFWGAALWLLNLVSDWGYAESSRPLLGWSYLGVLFGVFLDACVVTAFVAAVSSIAVTPLLPFAAGIAFALASRMLGPVLDYLRLGAAGDAQLQANFLPLIEKIRWLLPELARLDWRAGVLYGTWPAAAEIFAACVMALGYFLLFSAIAVCAYRRREFA